MAKGHRRTPKTPPKKPIGAKKQVFSTTGPFPLDFFVTALRLSAYRAYRWLRCFPNRLLGRFFQVKAVSSHRYEGQHHVGEIQAFPFFERAL